MQLTDYLLLFLAVALSGTLSFYIQSNSKSLLQISLSFSGAYIMGITAIHLLPDVYRTGQSSIGLWLLLGFFVQLLLEQLSKGLEHGHFHVPHHAGVGFALPIMLGLSIHAFFEGIPLSGYTSVHDSQHLYPNEPNHLYYGIILHHAPAAFALGLVLLSSGFKKLTVLSCLLMFAFMPPLGAFVGAFAELEPLQYANIIAIVIGSFLHVATTILFEMGSEHRIPLPKLIATAIGVGAALLTLL